MSTLPVASLPGLFREVNEFSVDEGSTLTENEKLCIQVSLLDQSHWFSLTRSLKVL